MISNIEYVLALLLHRLVSLNAIAQNLSYGTHVRLTANTMPDIDIHLLSPGLVRESLLVGSALRALLAQLFRTYFRLCITLNSVILVSESVWLILRTDISDILAHTTTTCSSFFLHMHQNWAFTHWLHSYNVMNRMKRSST